MALSLLVVLAVLLPFGGYAPFGPAAPGLESAAAQSYPGWMSPEQAALFTNDWPALVPSYVPEPFASVVPQIGVSGGYYRVYWMVPGGAPTYLEVTGTLGGYIPAGSFYDRNNQLFVNASVRGYEAYHDPTPVYDAVYWQEEGVTYWATAQGLPTDIVSYANGLVTVTPLEPEPTATVPAAATLYSPDSIASGGTGTVTASSGGAGATLVADGGYFPDTGTASYPGAGDAAVAWVAPDVNVDTTVTFSLLDASGAVLVTTPTLVTAAEATVPFALACAPTAGAGELLAVSVTGSGSVMLDASAGSWPQTSPNTEYDPGTDGATLAFSLGGGGTATLTWLAPATPQTATIQAYGPSGMVVGSCQVAVVGETPTAEPTAPVVTATIPATMPPDDPTRVAPTATVATGQPTAGSTATVPGTNPGDGTDPGSGPQPTVPGTGSGDGIDPIDGSAPPATVRPGDGTDFGGSATVPPGATYPAIPTGAPLPDAPPTSIPPSGGVPTTVGESPATVTAPSTTATVVPTRAAPTVASTAPPATVSASTNPSTRAPATEAPLSLTETAVIVPPVATSVPVSPSPTAPASSTVSPATTVPATATPTARATTVPPTATTAPPTSTPVSPTATTVPSTATAATTAISGQPSATPSPTSTSLPASPVPTITLPAATEAALAAESTVPPTATVDSPAPTSIPAKPTATIVPPTSVPATPTSVPPTATSVPATPTATSVPPTATTIPPTATPVPPTATATRRPPATATATPIRSDEEARVAGAQPTVLATVIPSVAPTAPLATPIVATPAATPVVPPAVEAVTQDIGPDGGTVRHPSGAELQIGPGVFASMMTVSMAQVPDTDLPVSPEVDLVPSSGYDIEITGADGRAVTTLPAGVVLRLVVPEDVRDDAVVYWIDDGELTQLGVTNQEEVGISAPLAHLSRYVAGVPLDENPEPGWLPWAVAIAAAISGLLVVGLLANHSRRQRRRGTRATRAG